MLRKIALLAFLLTAVTSAAGSGLADAVQQGDRAAVRRFLAAKVDVNEPQGDGMTALHWAAYNDDAETAAALIAAGANVQAVTRNEALTPLMVAASNGSASVIEKVLAAGANPNARTTDGATALMTAAASGSVKAVELLLDRKADVNAVDTARGESALMFAAAANRAAVITVLLKRGASAGLTSRLVSVGRTDYGAAPQPRPVPAKAPPKVDEALVKWKQERRGRAEAMGGLAALHFAARNGQLDAARALIEGGADINQPNGTDKSTPLVTAASNGHFELAKFLLDHGADPNLANESGLAPLYAAIEAQFPPTSWSPTRSTEQEKVTHLQLMQALLDHGANPNARLTKKLWFRPSDHDDAWIGTVGTTAFWRAAFANDADAMRLLFSRGADPVIASSERVTPIMVAAGLGWLPMIKVVPNARVQTVQLCLELGGNLNDADVFGYTALHGAAYRGDDELVKFLAGKGARLDAVTVFGTNVTDMANGFVAYTSLPREHPETVQLLMKLGAPVPSPSRPGEAAYCDASSLNCPRIADLR